MADSPPIDVARSERRWALGLSLGFALFASMIAVLLQQARHGQEIASDVREYLLYVEQPTILLHKIERDEIYGGRIAAPLLPLMLAGPFHLFKSLGCDNFLAFRFTNIAWLALGLGLSWRVVLARFGLPGTRGEQLIAVAMTLMPITWLASAVLTQDDCIAGAWGGICLYAWWRWDWLGCGLASWLAVFVAKPFFLLMWAAIWMSRSGLQKWLLVTGIAILVPVSFVGFIYWREGSLARLNHFVAPYMAGSIYSIWWLLLQSVSMETVSKLNAQAKPLALQLTLGLFASWNISSLFRTWSLPAAIVGLYSLLFIGIIGMMPEYELWYYSWVMLLAWGAWQTNDRWLFCALLSHNCITYFYKVCYTCDAVNFVRSEPSPLASYYQAYCGWSLYWPLMVISAMNVLSVIWIIQALWRSKLGRELEPRPQQNITATI